MPTLDEEIAASLRASLESGELKTAKSWGKPINFGDGYDDTPAELRMAFKILKDAGVAPPEVEMFQQVALLQAQLEAATDDERKAELKKQISDLQLTLSLRLESLAASREL
jgi:hypothetical protein